MYDAVIVGARCAGAALAIFLAQKGYKVAMVDRDTFPSHTTSTHVTGEIDIYQRLGVLEQLEAAGAPSLRRMHVHLGTSSFESDMLVTPRAIGLRRYHFDQILIQKAMSYPTVSFEQGSLVTGLIQDRGKVQGISIRKGAVQKELMANVIVGADGYFSFVASRVNAASYETSPLMRPAYYGYFRNVKPLPIPAVEWFWNEEDIIFCNPTDDDLHTVLVMPPMSEMKRWMRSPKDMLLERITKIPGLHERMQAAQLSDRVRGIGARPMYLKQAYGQGWALVGDAGAYVHPVTGSGMDNAVGSAELLSKALHEVFTGQASWENALKTYQTKRDELIKPQMHGAHVSMNRADQAINYEKLQWLQALCTFPGLTHDLAANVKEVARILGNERYEQLEKMMMPN
ncbi:NAD(P)/FAD-dependent oxidoreductase [Paenibacillus sp. 453mf]|uniref:NAD(P)/FAD-dependent oxidoreductase n=1 Tax=Paenibacillus sp. 453mf TaxID=1761874 RepID=UPI0008EE8EBD|nr:NAD(P)/FAD-dependent oxidoreductase [Paenibacillus sp. 453mf]SFS54636.1 2-polyprenyl-6-methoxyphenol hydroxylase [Paenibacillus sp. 453mf]